MMLAYDVGAMWQCLSAVPANFPAVSAAAVLPGCAAAAAMHAVVATHRIRRRRLPAGASPTYHGMFTR